MKTMRGLYLSLALVLSVLVLSVPACEIECGCEVCLDGNSGCFCENEGNLVINEAQYVDGALHFTEVVNVGETINLKGYTLHVGDLSYILAKEDTYIKGGEVFLLQNTNGGTSLCGSSRRSQEERGQIIYLQSAVSKHKAKPSSSEDGVVTIDLSIEDASGNVDATFYYQGDEVDGVLQVARQPDIVGSPEPSNCIPWTRRSGELFRRLLVSEVMIDAGLNDYNGDGATGELSEQALGMQDAYIEIVNQECYSVDVSDFSICITCPNVCVPEENDSGELSCPFPDDLPCTPFHVFPSSTVIPPGGAVLVFGGYNNPRGGESGGIQFSLSETSPFGFSLVQVASLPHGEQQFNRVALADRRKRLGFIPGFGNDTEIVIPHTFGVQQLLPLLPCESCIDKEQECDPDSTGRLLLVGAEPQISYRVSDEHDNVVVSAVLPVLHIVSGVSFDHVPDPTPHEFVPHCTGPDTCGCDDTCSSPGVRVNGDLFVYPDVVGVKSVSLFEDNDSSGCLSPGDVAEVSTHLFNRGSQPAFNVQFWDSPFEHSELIAGSVLANGESCVVESGNYYSDTEVQIRIPELCICENKGVYVTYKVLITDSFYCGHEGSVETQGNFNWENSYLDTPVSTTSDVSLALANSPTVVSFCVSPSLVVVGNAFASASLPGQIAWATLTVLNAGTASACQVTAETYSEILDCTANATVFELEELKPHESVSFPYSCSVPVPYPCVDDDAAVHVYVQDIETDRVEDTTHLHVEVTDSVNVLLTSECSSDESGCCLPGSVVSYSGVITNYGSRSACNVVFEFPFIEYEIGELVVGSVVAENCIVNSGNTYGQERDAVKVTCSSLLPAQVQNITFGLQVFNVLPRSAVYSTDDSHASVELTFDQEETEKLYSSSSTTIWEHPTIVCIAAAPDAHLSKTCALTQEDITRYELLVRNNGTQVADVLVSDPVGSFYAFDKSVSDECSYDEHTHTVNCNFVGVNPGTLRSAIYTATVNPNSPAGQSSQNEASATVVAGRDDRETLIYSDIPDCDDVNPLAVLTVVKDFPDSLGALSSAHVTVTVTNDASAGSNQAVSSFILKDIARGCRIIGDMTFTPSRDHWTCTDRNDYNFTLVGPALHVGESASVEYSCETPATFAWDAEWVCNDASVQYNTAERTDQVSTTACAAVDASVDLHVTKDVVGNEERTPGDVVEYAIRIDNIGTRDAHDVLLFDVFGDAPLESPTNCGVEQYQIVLCSEGQDACVASCDYDSLLSSTAGFPIGDIIADGGCTTVNYFLRLSCPVAIDVESVDNSAYVTYVDVNAPYVDDCDDRRSSTKPVSARIDVVAYSHVTVEKIPSVGLISPGSSFTYTVIFTNSGNRDVEDVSFSDDISDKYLHLVVGSVAANGTSTISEGNVFGDGDYVQVSVGTLHGTCGNLYENVREVAFDVAVVGGTSSPGGSVKNVCNQGETTFTSLQDGETTIVTNDPSTSIYEDATCVPIDHRPHFIIDGVCNPNIPAIGDIVEFHVTIANDGNIPGADLIYTGILDQNLQLIPGSLSVPATCDEKNAVLSGNHAGDTNVQVILGFLDRTDSFELSFSAIVSSSFVPQPDHPEAVGLTNIVGTVDEVYDIETSYCDVVGLVFGVQASKTYSLASRNGARPGDLLQYTIVVSNAGNTVADVTLYDLLSNVPEGCIDSPLRLVQGSVDSDRGTISSGNAPNDEDVDVKLGVLQPWESTTVIFEAHIADPFPCVNDYFTNQAKLYDAYSDRTSWSDDPTTDPIGDPTRTNVDARPLISAYKAVSIDGTPFSCTGCSPSQEANYGDILVYELSVVNDGNQAALNVIVTDCLDPSLQFMPDSLILNGSPVDPANVFDVDTGSVATSATRTFQTNIHGVAGYSTSTLVFSALVTENVRSSTIKNQAIVSGDNFNQVLSTAPDSSVSEVATSIGVNARPSIHFTLAASNSTASPGDQIAYTIVAIVSESSSAAAFNVLIQDVVDTSVMSLNLGSVVANRGVILEGNNAGDSNLRVQVDEIGLGEDNNVTVYFTVTLVSSFPAGVNSASNQATISGDNSPIQVSDNPATPVLGDATVVSVWTSPVLSALPSAVYDGRTVDETNPVPPGQKLTNVIEVSNSGTQDSADTVLTVEIDRDTTFIPGSVTVKCTDTCKVVQGNRVGDAGPVVVSLGTLSAGSNAAATVSFSVTVNNPFGGRSPVATFPVLVESSNANDFNVDSQVAVDAKPSLSISMTCDKCLTGAPDCGGALNPGTILQATATITNKGNQDAFDVFFLNNPLPPIKSDGPAYDVYPTSLAGGLESIPDADGNGSLIVTFPRLPGGGQSIQFSYTLIMTTDPPVGDQLTQNLFVWSNDGTAEFSGEFPCSSLGRSRSVDQTRNAASRKKSETAVVRTNALARQGSCPPTFVPCSGLVNTVAACGNVVATISKDNDKDGTPSTGDVMLFSVTLYIQSSCSNLDGVTFQDIPDPINSRLVVGTTRTTLGQIISGNAEGDGSVILALGELPGNRQIQVAVSFEVLITGNAAGFRTLTNWGEIGINRYGVYQINDISPEVQFTTNVPGFQSSASQVTLSVAAIFFALVAALF